MTVQASSLFPVLLPFELQDTTLSYLSLPEPEPFASPETNLDYILNQRCIQRIRHGRLYDPKDELIPFETRILNELKIDVVNLTATPFGDPKSAQLQKECYAILDTPNTSIEAKLTLLSNKTFKGSYLPDTYAFVSWCRERTAMILIRYITCAKVKSFALRYWGNMDTHVGLPYNNFERGLTVFARYQQPLNIASLKGHNLIPLICQAPFDIVKILVKLGININSCHEGISVLRRFLTAYYSGKEGITLVEIQWLLQHGALVDTAMLIISAIKKHTILRAERLEYERLDRFLKDASKSSADLLQIIRSLEGTRYTNNLISDLDHYEQMLLQRIVRTVKRRFADRENMVMMIVAIAEKLITIDQRFQQITEATECVIEELME